MQLHDFGTLNSIVSSERSDDEFVCFEFCKVQVVCAELALAAIAQLVSLDV